MVWKMYLLSNGTTLGTYVEFRGSWGFISSEHLVHSQPTQTIPPNSRHSKWAYRYHANLPQCHVSPQEIRRLIKGRLTTGGGGPLDFHDSNSSKVFFFGVGRRDSFTPKHLNILLYSKFQLRLTPCENIRHVPQKWKKNSWKEFLQKQVGFWLCSRGYFFFRGNMRNSVFLVKEHFLSQFRAPLISRVFGENSKLVIFQICFTCKMTLLKLEKNHLPTIQTPIFGASKS